MQTKKNDIKYVDLFYCVEACVYNKNAKAYIICISERGYGFICKHTYTVHEIHVYDCWDERKSESKMEEEKWTESKIETYTENEVLHMQA